VRWFRWLGRRRRLPERIAAETDDDATYWSATDLHSLAGINLAARVPTPMWSSADGPAALEEYFSKWCKRLGISRAIFGQPRS
jgi:hypothetical protein